MDPFVEFKESQKKAWSTFAPTEMFTCQPAARLVTFARIRSGARVLDVGCGTGVVALAAARTGARVTGLDLTPELLEHARENAAIAGVDVEWHQGDVEDLPFADESFDVVVSQFGHMFAPRPEVAIREMLRVLAPGGTVAFATWPPDVFTGRLFALIGRRIPPPPGVAPPAQWGSSEVIRERLGDAVRELHFDRATLRAPSLSVPHVRHFFERSVGPVQRLMREFAHDPATLAEIRGEIDALVAAYFEPTENVLRQDYLLTRAAKA